MWGDFVGFSAVCGEASGQVLLRGLSAHLDRDAVSDGCEPDYLAEGGAFSGTQTADVDVHWAGRDVLSADLLPMDSTV